jgi:CBS domain-containing protein
MQARDVMSEKLATATPGMAVRDAAAKMLERRVSALPVVDEHGALVGIVSEGDLLHRGEIETERKSSWWLELVATPEERAREFVKSHGQKVGDIMTRRVVTVDPTTPLSDIAMILEVNRIKRVPIVEDTKLIGIVSRADLIRALAVHELPTPPSEVNDASLRDAIQSLLTSRQLGGPLINIVVAGGVVHLWGLVRSQDEHHAIAVAAATVPGVARVDNHVSVGPWLGYAE